MFGIFHETEVLFALALILVLPDPAVRLLFGIEKAGYESRARTLRYRFIFVSQTPMCGMLLALPLYYTFIQFHRLLSCMDSQSPVFCK